MKKKISLTLLLLLAACSNPKDQVIPPDITKLDENSPFVVQMKKLDPADKLLLTQYLMLSQLREGFGGEKRPLGITVAEAIEAQKKFNAMKAAEETKASAIRNAALAEQQQKLDAIQNAFKIYFVKLGPIQKANYQQYFTMDLSIANTSGKLVKGFKAAIAFHNQFDEPIKTLTIEENADWEVGQEGTYTYTYDYNQFDDDINKLVAIPQDKLKVKATITDVIF